MRDLRVRVRVCVCVYVCVCEARVLWVVKWKKGVGPERRRETIEVLCGAELSLNCLSQSM